jgi:hypothetical protein
MTAPLASPSDVVCQVCLIREEDWSPLEVKNTEGWGERSNTTSPDRGPWVPAPRFFRTGGRESAGR